MPMQETLPATSGQAETNVRPTLIVVTSDPEYRASLLRCLQDAGRPLILPDSLEKAAHAIQTCHPSVVMMDGALPDESWTSLVSTITKISAPPRVVVARARHHLERSLRAIHGGAFGLFDSHCDPREMQGIIDEADHVWFCQRDRESIWGNNHHNSYVCNIQRIGLHVTSLVLPGSAATRNCSICATILLCLSLGSPHLHAQATPQATDLQIQTAEEHLRKNPGSYTALDELGAAYFQKSRETGDASALDAAEKALGKAIDVAPHDSHAAEPLVHLALVYMGEHRFTDALATAQKVIALGSGNLSAFAIEGDAYTDLGRYSDAEDAYNALRTVGSTLTSPSKIAFMLDSRMSYLRFLYGDSAAAIDLMESALLAASQTNVPRENLAWLYFEWGERLFQTGDLTRAERAYQSGIAADPHHYRSLAGLAKVRAAQGRWPEAVQLYEQSLAVVPFPQYLAELGDLYTRMGNAAKAAEQYDLIEYIGRLSRINQVLANRELALFYADRGIKLDEALQFARNEFAVRSDIYTWDALAWVLHRKGDPAAATEAMQKALALGTEDPLLLFHAGMIAHSQGKDADARHYLAEALRLNSHFHVLYALKAAETLNSLPPANTLSSAK